MTMDERDETMETADVVRFGIIGCGGIGKWHARCLVSIPGATLSGVADTDQSARDRAARTFGAEASDSVDAMLGADGIDVVSICTPPASHVALVTAAAAAGKHVLVEKPLALDLSEADRAVAACASRNVHLGVVHQQRGRSATRALHRLILDGELGKPLMAAAIHTWFRTDSQLEADLWRGDAKTGGGVLLDQAVHAIDLLVWFLGAPRWVSGSTAMLARHTLAEDTAVATIGFDGGAVATLAASTSVNACRDDIAVEVAGTRGLCRLEVRDYDHAEIVRLELANSDDRRARALPAGEIESLVQRFGGQWRRGPRAWPWRGLARFVGRERGSQPFRDPRAVLRRKIDRIAQSETRELQGHAAILHSMADAVRGRGLPLVSGAEARHSIAIIDAIQRSHRVGGERVELVSTGTP
jgi:predicted dehydrogenase